jgi:hypothetical protein
MQQSPEEGAGGEDDCTRLDAYPATQLDAACPMTHDSQSCNLFLYQGHARKALDQPPQEKRIGHLVALCARTPHRRPARLVERLELNPGSIGGPTLKPTKSINFGHQVPLADAANSWITRHLADGAPVKGHQNDRCSHPSRGRRRLTTRMTTTHHDQIGFHPRSYFPMQNLL